jgi:AcrR family transcriptional regulator
MHSMVESASELRRVRTAHQIAVCAQRLTVERGLDGFTMDDLAEAAGVSRRTLFNYYPSKFEAVLGPVHDIEPELMQEFRDRGPSGDLIEDIGAVLSRVFEVKGFDRADAEVARLAVRSDPRLLAAAHHRFESITADFTDLLLEREGPQFGVHRARILLVVIAGLHDVVLDQVLADETGRLTMPVAYVEALRTARDVLS